MLNQPLVTIEKLSLRRGKTYILEDITFTIKPGEIITIIGPNGGGKTTLAKIIAGIELPTKGKIIRSESLKIGYVPQHIKIDKVMPLTVKNFLQLNNITNPLLIYENLNTILYKNLHDLSRGQLQRVMLIRALALQSELLILDEPVQALDINAQFEFYQLLEKLRLEKKISILMISHDLHMVMRSTDQVICLNQHICCRGKAEDVNAHPKFLELFGTQASPNIGLYTHQHDHQHNNE